jgi:putative membrane protein
VAHMGLLGALIVFAPVAVYGPHLLTTAPWGLTALEDQQLAGLVMWTIGLAPYLGATLVLGWRRLAAAA